MKNIFSKTTENRTQNGVKSYLSPTFVLSPILIFAFLTLGVGQMWAYNFYSPYIYFNNADLKWGDVMLLVGHNSYSCGYNATTNMISNTKLVYFAPDASWGDQDGFTVCKASNWPCASEAFTARAGYATHIGLQYSYGFNYHESYYVTGNTSGTINISAGRPPSKDATQGAKWRDTGTSYSITTGTYPATLKLQGTYLSGDGKSTRSTITSTASTDGDAKKVYGAVVTGEITHSFESLNSSYYFEGWGTGSTPSSTENTYLYNISENTTTYAFFSKTYTLTYDRKGTFGNSTLSVDVSDFNGTKESGSAIPTGHQITFTATPADGYVIEGWYSDAECTKSLDNGQNTKYTISSLDADKSVYVKFEQLKTITIKIAHEVTAGWTIQGVSRYPESGGRSISADGKWVTIEFTNVYAVSNIDLAYSGGDWDYLNTATKITGDCCYNKDGSLNASCCVPPANPTWGTAPANGAIGGSMTATINNVPDGATIEWSSSATSYATVDNSGHITYVAAGNATITAHVTWSATGDYCAGSYDLTKEISCTSGATVSVERTCAAYVAVGVAGQVSAHITFTGTSSGWKYRIKQSWSAGYETGWLDASGTSADWTMTGGMDAGERTYTVELYTTEGAATPVSTANFSVTGETAYNTTIAAGANGSVSPSGTVYANNNHVHPTITATPNEHYHFVNWTSNNAAASVADDNSATTTVTATASGYTITANFAGDKYTITYKDQGGVDYSGNNIGSLPATHTYGTATDLVNGTKEGFTFGGWYTDEACTVSAGYSIGATAKTSNFTLYAKWTEKMSALSTSNHYNVGNPKYAIPAKTASSIGIATTATLTATTPSTGYTFAGWTLSSNLVVTSGNKDTDLSITVRTNGDGAAATAQANYNEDLRSSWHLVGNSSDFPGGWDVNKTTMMQKKTGHSTESAVYFTINVTSKDAKEFKIVDDNGDGKDIWYGYSSTSGIYLTWTKTSTKNVYTGDGNTNNLKYTPTVVGSYEFKVDYSGTYPAVTITYPTAYTVTYGVGTGYTPMGRVSTEPSISSGDYVIAGTNITFTATPNLGYKFVGWYSDEACTRSLSTDNPYTVSVTEEKNVYAKFELLTLYMNSDINNWESAIHLTHTADNPAVYTYTGTLNANPTTDPTTYATGWHFEYCYNEARNEKAYQYTTVETLSPSGSSIDGVNTYAGANTIQFGLTRKSDVTITLTLKTPPTKPTVHIAADPYYDITYTAPSHGTYTIQVGNAAAVSTNTDARATTTITLANTPATGYHLDSWTVAKSEGNVEVSNNQFTMPAENVTVSAAFTANTYSVQFNGNGATDGSMANQDFTYDAAQKLTANAFTKTGYTFAGWALSADGEVVYRDEEEVSNLTPVNNGTATLYAKWTPNQYTVTLDKQTSEEGYGGNEGTVANQTVTFDATLTTVSGSMPIAKNGWAFMGFYSAKDGGGRQFINPSGNWVTNAGDTIRDSKWVYDGNVTLYAYYKKAEITDLIFDAAVVAPSASVGVTPKVDPTPAGTNSICWKLLYNNGNLYTPQPEFRPENPGGVDNKVTFNAPPTSGMYLVAAVLRTGSSCDGGTKLDSVTYPFQVAGDHTVTVQYKCGDVTLQGSTSVSARPLDWSTEITPDDIFGYTFEKWVAGDSVTMTIDGGETTIETGGETTGKAGTHAIQIKAIYDGKLIAKYTKKNIIYFKNTLGWSEVYVNLYPYAWWNSSKGAGNESLADDKRNKQMTQLGETDIWYYEYGNTATMAYVSFTDRSQNNYAGFAGTSSVNKVQVSYPTRPYATEDEDANYGFNAGTPMFVPTAGQTAQPWNKSGNDDLAEYYNKGYWRKYDPIQGETGYTLKVYNMTEDNGRTELKSIKFVESDVPGQLFKAVANLEAAGGYGIKFERDNSMLYTNISGHLQSTGDVVVTEKQDANYRAIWIKATAAGDYTFAITINGDGKLCIQAEFPVAKDDYRVIYTDNATWTKAHTAHTWIHPSRIISAEENAVDTISFFVSKGHSPEFKIQKVNTIDEGTGAITWTDVTSWTSCDDVDASGVYNFIFTQDGSKNIRFTKKEPYTGNFYIRTDAAGSTKWDNYRAADHLMTYSEYSKDHSDYTHYFVKFVREGTNVKFVVANDYSPCISDTLIRQTYRGGDSDHVDENGFLNGDLLGDGVNVRFMWDIRNNAVMRAYLAPAQKNGSKFLVLRSNSSEDLRDEYDVALTGDSEGFPGNNHGGGANCMQFVDNENWIYEATVMVRPSAYVKLYGHFHGTDFYFKGNNNDDFNDTKIDGIPNAIQLVTGSTGSRVKVRVIYDFKTDRLLAAMVPSGEISTEMAINADVMFIREHQGDIKQLIFNGSGKITDIKTAYAVMRFNKWTLNNKEKTGSNDPLASPASIYERSLYYVSFPFPVNLSEVFGFGTYGQHWIIQRYRGDLRAQQGFWAESDGFWEFIWNRNGVVLQPNEGYILTLETELLGEESDVWGPDHRSNQIELFFPSTGPLGSITNASVTQELPKHTCTIDKTKDQFGNPTGLQDSSNPSTSYNRTVFDSHWNIMSVPTYVNVDDPSFASTTWIGGSEGNVGPKFLYTWNMNDNTLTATSGTDFVYHAMHAYTVQYYGDVTWTTSVTPPAAPQRNTEYRGEYEFCLEVQQDDQMIDRTYVRLSDDENVTTGFEFSEDMTKQFNSRKANIFTIAGNTSLGGNSLPLSTTQTTVVPVGVKIKTAGDYTFAIPEGTDGIGVTLVDNETGVRTLLSALDYTVNLTAGTHDGRFILEISPIQNTPTGIEEPTSDSSLKGRAQKRIIDGVLYIVKDGKIFDARGTRVE